jgi:hypothetical protein
MLYMIIEYFNAGAAPDIYRRARERGRQLPDGSSTSTAGWTDYFRCFQVMRTDDRADRSLDRHGASRAFRGDTRTYIGRRGKHIADVP